MAPRAAGSANEWVAPSSRMTNLVHLVRSVETECTVIWLLNDLDGADDGHAHWLVEH